jgi:hypothetical protein
MKLNVTPQLVEADLASFEVKADRMLVSFLA